METEQYTYRGFTESEIRVAMKRIEPMDWKDPIKATVPSSALGVSLAAVAFYTATEATATKLPGGIYRLEAPGYRAGPAGDH